MSRAQPGRRQPRQDAASGDLVRQWRCAHGCPDLWAMYIHHMHRTQLYLDRTIHARLKALAKRRGRTVSELVRDALALVYGSSESGERITTLRGIAGLWRDRTDLGDTDAYVRRLRRDTRRTRHRS
jgi:hypothetical protein